MIPPKYLAAMEAVKYLLALCIVLSLATAGTVGLGLLLLGLAVYGCKLYTWPPIRDHYRAKREFRERCYHQWGEPQEVSRHPYGFGPHFFKAWCSKCGEQKNVNEDGTDYVPYQWLDDDK